jgi:hypothetical protein
MWGKEGETSNIERGHELKNEDIRRLSSLKKKAKGMWNTYGKKLDT